MTKRIEVASAPASLEEYVKHFDQLFGRSNQRQGFRQYLEGLLLPSERHKTLTGLVNAEPFRSAQSPRTQKLQWFLSESDWDVRQVQAQRLRLLREDSSTAPNGNGVLVIDETGDRKDGHKTANVARQYLANLGKIGNGVVSVSSLWADERLYYPLVVAPYTPASYFEEGERDRKFRTKSKIALELVKQAIQEGFSFRAVVADSYYGEDFGFKMGLGILKVPYVMALDPSRVWWHAPGVAGSLQDLAREISWVSAKQPGKWVGVRRMFRDGSMQDWWAVEIEAGPYGPDKKKRAIVATTDPKSLPDLSTWYLVTNLPAQTERPENELLFPPANLEEVIRLYGLRMWVKQSYKHAQHTLGWSQYQVRSDRAIRRHWQLVCCAFSFCWYHVSHPSTFTMGEPKKPSESAALPGVPEKAKGTRKQNQPSKKHAASDIPVNGQARDMRVSGTFDHAEALLERLLSTAPIFSVTTPAHLA